MSQLRTVLRILIGIIAAVLVAAAPTAVWPAMSAGSASPPGVSPVDDVLPRAATTKLVVKVKGCRGCKVRGVVTGDGGRVLLWQGHRRVNKKGRAVLRVPTELTAGLNLTIDSPADTVNFDGAGATNVVMRYEGLAVGARVSSRAARTAVAGYGCWSGTSRSRAALKVRVAHFRAKDSYPPYRRGLDTRAYLVRGVDALADRYQVSRGKLGSQDWIGCTRPGDEALAFFRETQAACTRGDLYPPGPWFFDARTERDIGSGRWLIRDGAGHLLIVDLNERVIYGEGGRDQPLPAAEYTFGCPEDVYLGTVD